MKVLSECFHFPEIETVIRVGHLAWQDTGTHLGVSGFQSGSAASQHPGTAFLWAAAGDASSSWAPGFSLAPVAAAVGICGGN